MTLLAVIAFAATIAFLFMGIRSMVQGGDYDQQHGTQFMALRVGAQAAALALLVLAMLSTLE